MKRGRKEPLKIPEGVIAEIEGQQITVKGPKGNLKLILRQEISIRIEDNKIFVERKSNNSRALSLYGLTRTLIGNMMYGVTSGWNKGLLLTGVGYRAKIEGDSLILNVGFSHPVIFKAKEGIAFEVKENRINVKGPDKQLVGETAAQIRRTRPVEPYKGKGIRYVGEIVRKKAGKTAKTAGPTTK